MKEVDLQFADIAVAFFLTIQKSNTLLGDTLEELLNPFKAPNAPALADAWDFIKEKYQAVENPLGVLTFSSDALESAKRLVATYTECGDSASVRMYQSMAQQAQ